MTRTGLFARQTQGEGRLRRGLSAAFLLLFLACAPLVWAQVLYGVLTGTVTDPTGAAVPNAIVNVRNQNNGETRTIKTNGSGEYTVRDVQPGQYTVEVPAEGNFGGYKQENVAVTVNTEARINVNLKPASVTSEVTVTTAPPLLQTETAEVNSQISTAEIAELPITSSQGRNFQALYTLIPGAAAVGEQNSTASNPSRAESANFNGVEDMGNTTRIDGAVNTYGWLPYLIAYVPPADAIQTVNITTNSFNAEQGMAGGASINVIIKSGTNDLHGSVWEYNQLFNTNARPYTATTGRIPKNIFNQYGFTVGGPITIPHLVNGKNKLFFFQAFERTTRRQSLTGLVSVPTTAVLSGNFAGATTLYDPDPGGVLIGPNDPRTLAGQAVSGYLLPQYRPTFASEYGNGNVIPAARISKAASALTALLQPISAQVSTNSLNNYQGAGTFSYNRITSDSKVTWNPTDRTSLFGRYSVEPFNVTDPQNLGQAGGGTFDGGQPGLGHGRIQNVGLGFTHVLTPSLVLDADGGYTRQVTGAQSAVDIALGNFGLNQQGIPGTNGPTADYEGQPAFDFCGLGSSGTCFSNLGNANGGNPFLFRDNQFTGDVNLSYTKGNHATKYGFSYYHFDLNHFQPTSGANINTPRGGFQFLGNMTDGGSATPGNDMFTAFADFLLGLPNDNAGAAIAHPYQINDPNSLRWTQIAVYAQDQWTLTPKLTLNYGVRYEFYPAPYRDHTGVYRLDPTLPQTANVEIGGVNGNPENAGIDMGWGQLWPRVGVAYRVNDRLVIRSGGGFTSDPDSLRFLRDSFPIDQAPSFSGPANYTIAVDPTNKSTYSTGAPLPLTVGIPNPAAPNLSSGYASLPVSGGTNTTPANYRRGYIESWNLFLQQDLGARFVWNVGYVGTHQVRQLTGYTLNAAPLASSGTPCMANGRWNASTGLTGTCNYQANALINTQHCPATNPLCYNTGGITMNQPLFSANYNGLQTQLSRSAGRLSQFGLVYTWSHAFNYEDNGAGSGSAGTAFSYPAYFKMNRATASYDRPNNLQFWGIYQLPFGRDQIFLSHGVAGSLLGGFQLNGQISHVSGAPFSVSPASSTLNSPGNTQYATLVKPYRQLGGHARTVSSATQGASPVSGGLPWFDPTSFANTPANTFANTHRNEFRGPGTTLVNASVFRAFHVWRESEFQVRVEAFNLLNHPILSTNPNAIVGGSTLGYITGFGGTRTLQYSGRFNF